jgi:hypothetical protein
MELYVVIRVVLFTSLFAAGPLLLWRGWPRLIKHYPNAWQPALWGGSLCVTIMLWMGVAHLRPVDDTQLVTVSGTVTEISEPYRRAGGKHGVTYHRVDIELDRSHGSRPLWVNVPARTLARPLGYLLSEGETVHVRMSPKGNVYQLDSNRTAVLSLKDGRHADGWASRMLAYPATLFSVTWVLLGLCALAWPWLRSSLNPMLRER